MKAAAKNKGKQGKDEVEPTVFSGVYMFPNGDKYEGDFIKSADGVMERSGFGTQTTSDGTVYAGSWSGDRMTGQGRLECPSGAVYEGQFLNNQFNGKGKYIWSNQSYYEGEFVENRMEGEGEFTDTDGQKWTGKFRYKAAPGLRFKLNL